VCVLKCDHGCKVVRTHIGFVFARKGAGNASVNSEELLAACADATTS
jgi:hypothetical protein